MDGKQNGMYDILLHFLHRSALFSTPTHYQLAVSISDVLKCLTRSMLLSSFEPSIIIFFTIYLLLKAKSATLSLLLSSYASTILVNHL